jgi:hypothetical protein
MTFKILNFFFKSIEKKLYKKNLILLDIVDCNTKIVGQNLGQKKICLYFLTFSLDTFRWTRFVGHRWTKKYSYIYIHLLQIIVFFNIKLVTIPSKYRISIFFCFTTTYFFLENFFKIHFNRLCIRNFFINIFFVPC